MVFSALKLPLTGLIMYHLEFSNKVENFKNVWSEEKSQYEVSSDGL